MAFLWAPSQWRSDTLSCVLVLVLFLIITFPPEAQQAPPKKHAPLHCRCERDISERSSEFWLMACCVCHCLSSLLVFIFRGLGEGWGGGVANREVRRRALSQTGLPSNRSRAEIAVPQLGLPALVLDHITLRQQERWGSETEMEIKETMRGEGEKMKRTQVRQ